MAPVNPPIGTLLGHYRLLQKIGAGGMGVVYRAHDERLDRDVALKVLSEEGLGDENARRMFHREALTISKLSHSNIANVFDFDTQEGLDFLVMEYVCGTTLAEKIARGALPQQEVLGLGLQIVKALEAAHEKGVVHCDLKPGNIMVTTSQQQVKLLDFGLAKLLRISETATTETVGRLCTFGGTVPYMSPEQLLGKVPDFRSDIYSLGAVLYEMATGRRPFEEKVSTALTEEILHRPPFPPTLVNPSISPRFQDVILKCLEKDSDDRYQSVKELIVDLRHLATPSGVPIEIAERTHATHRQKQNKVMLGTIVILALLASIGFASRYLRARPRKHQVVLVGDFSNRTDDRVFDEVIPELLTINLEQSGFISVFPSSRRSEILRLMKLGSTASIDEAVGMEICQREALNAVIVGSITKLGNSYVLAARVLSPGGQSLAGTQDVVASAADLPASLDKMSIYLRNALGESREEIQTSSIPVADVTSSSLPAIRKFLAGKKQLYAGAPVDAKASFDAALELDPSFAMAQEYLGIAYLHQGNPVRAQEEIMKTLSMLDHVTEQERHKILGDYSLLRRDFDQAMVHFRFLKGMRPRDAAPSLNLAQCFEAKLNFDSALEETKAALEIDPGAGARNNLAEIYLLKGDILNALKTSTAIVQENAENVRGMENLGWAYLLNNQLSEARDAFERMIKSGGDGESRGRSVLADLAISSGRYKEAKQQLEAGIVVDRRLGNLFAARKKQLTFLASSSGGGKHSLSGRREHEEPGTDPQLVLLEGLYCARAKLRDEVTRDYGRIDSAAKSNPVPTLQSFREMLAAELALLDNTPDAAVSAAKRAVDLENSSLALQVLAESYAAARKPAAAISAYEKVLRRAAERSQSYDAPAYHELIEIHYKLGVLYQDSGDVDKARLHLDQFLKSWSNPDGTPSIYIDAKARLRRLSAAETRRGTPAPAM